MMEKSDQDPKMPKSRAPNMVEIKFSVPAPLLADALELAELEGLKPADLYRMFWVMGSGCYAEQSNKRLVNRQLRAKLEPQEEREEEKEEGDED
jgi:hypothetical protein